jgi:hypothetical protein
VWVMLTPSLSWNASVISSLTILTIDAGGSPLARGPRGAGGLASLCRPLAHGG